MSESNVTEGEGQKEVYYETFAESDMIIPDTCEDIDKGKCIDRLGNSTIYFGALDDGI